ncbi:MAG: hypothetical protein Q9207_004203 [Kuettlingeria erythrocarpa]
MAPSLASLPPELLHEIIGSLFEYSDLLNLGLCCRAFHAAVLPFVYAHITFLRAWEGDDLRLGPHLHLKDLTTRFQTDPVLASLVRAVQFPDECVKDTQIACDEEPMVLKLLQALSNLKLLDFVSPSFSSDLDSAVFQVAISKVHLAEGIDYWIGMFVIFGAANWESHLDHKEMSIDVRELPNLERLLPRGLQTIFFTHTQGRIGLLVGALANLLRSKPASMTRLQEISFEAHLEGNEHAPPLTELGELAVAKKVMLRAIDLPVDEYRGYDYDYEDPGIPDMRVDVGFWPGVTSSEGFGRTWTQGSDFIWRREHDDIQEIFDEGELHGLEQA